MNINKKYINKIKNICKNGDIQKVRAKWSDNIQATTLAIFQDFQKYKNIENNFPIISLRKIFYKTAINEALWIFQKRSNKLKDLNSNIWQSWDYNSTGTIGHTYGFICNKEYESMENLNKDVFGDKKYLNQVEYLFQTLMTNPLNRRMMINLYDLSEVHKSNLPPCAFMTLWSYSQKSNKLNMTLIQRSGDYLVASGIGGHNCVQYSFLLCLIAKCVGMNVGTFTHFVQNNHIYDKHISDNNLTEYCLQDYSMVSKVQLKINVKHKKPKNLKEAWENFMSFTEKDYKIKNYNPLDYKLKLEVAI